MTDLEDNLIKVDDRKVIKHGIRGRIISLSNIMLEHLHLQATDYGSPLEIYAVRDHEGIFIRKKGSE